MSQPGSKPTSKQSQPSNIRSSGRDTQGILATSFRTGSPVADALARDLAECSDTDLNDSTFDDAADTDRIGGHFVYRRASGVAYGSSRPVLNDRGGSEEPPLTAMERKQTREAERSLLRDNHILPPKHKKKSDNLVARLYRWAFSTKLRVESENDDADTAIPPTETSPLLNGHNRAPSSTDSDHLEEQWEEAVASGLIRTTWQRESKTLIEYSIPLIITFVLQYSINVASIFAVGRIGKLELGAVTCKSMFILLFNTNHGRMKPLHHKSSFANNFIFKKNQWQTCLKRLRAWRLSKVWRPVSTRFALKPMDRDTSILLVYSANAWHFSYLLCLVPSLSFGVLVNRFCVSLCQTQNQHAWLVHISRFSPSASQE